ncbi:MAG: hypothetical protein AB7N76_17565 [Planctomycetota bacterium]
MTELRPLPATGPQGGQAQPAGAAVAGGGGALVSSPPPAGEGALRLRLEPALEAAEALLTDPAGARRRVDPRLPLEGLRPGRYRVSVLGRAAGGPRWAEGEVEVQDSAAALRLPVRACSSLQVRLLDAAGRPARGWVSVRALDPGREGFSLGLLSPSRGREDAFWAAETAPLARSFEVSPAGTLELSLPQGRWGLVALGLDPRAVRAEAEVELGTSPQQIDLGLGAAAPARVALPQQLQRADAWITLSGPPGVSLARSGAELVIRGLGSRDRARLEVSADADDEGPRWVACLEPGPGTRATLVAQRAASARGRVLGGPELMRLELHSRRPAATGGYRVQRDYSDLEDRAADEGPEDRGTAHEGIGVDLGVAWVEPAGDAEGGALLVDLASDPRLAAVSRGSFAFDELLPGRYRLVLRGRGGDGAWRRSLLERDVETLPGARQDWELVSPR